MRKIQSIRHQYKRRLNNSQNFNAIYAHICFALSRGRLHLWSSYCDLKYDIPYFRAPPYDIPVDLSKECITEFRILMSNNTEWRMQRTIFSQLGEQLRVLREERGWTQPDVATRVGRSPARISELERDLLDGRRGRDRLTLFAELCDALNVVPILVPQDRAVAMREMVAPRGRRIHSPESPGSAFDDLFVDLGDADDEDAR